MQKVYSATRLTNNPRKVVGKCIYLFKHECQRMNAKDAYTCRFCGNQATKPF